MVKSIHDLSNDEIEDLYKGIQDLLEESKQIKNKDKTRNKDSKSRYTESSSWLSTIEESNESDDNSVKQKLSPEKSNEIKDKHTKNLIDEKYSLDMKSLENLIKADDTLKELQKLTWKLQEEKSESVTNENEFDGSSKSFTTLTEETKIPKNCSIASNISLECNQSAMGEYEPFETDLSFKTTKETTPIHKEIQLSNELFKSKEKRDNSLILNVEQVVHDRKLCTNGMDYIKSDNTLKQSKRLASTLKNDKSKSESNKNKLAYSSASWATLTEENKKSSNSSISTPEATQGDTNKYKPAEADLCSKTSTEKSSTYTGIKGKKERKKSSPLKPNVKQEVYIFQKGVSESKPTKSSNTSIKLKKKIQKSESAIKKLYSEGSPDYIKGHYVPTINRKRKKLLKGVGWRREFSQGRVRLSTLEEEIPTFPLKIDCISMFSDSEELEEEGGTEEEILEESFTESSSDLEEPDVLLKQLWNDLLLPSDESDLDLKEFYKQFPKLKKKEYKKRIKESMIETPELISDDSHF